MSEGLRYYDSDKGLAAKAERAARRARAVYIPANREDARNIVGDFLCEILDAPHLRRDEVSGYRLDVLCDMLAVLLDRSAEMDLVLWDEVRALEDDEAENFDEGDGEDEGDDDDE